MGLRPSREAGNDMMKLIKNIQPSFWALLAFGVVVFVAELYVALHFIIKFW